ncbi:MAG: hypothetical protein ACK5ZR_10300 [Gemmatimonadaceae bacterium]
MTGMESVEAGVNREGLRALYGSGTAARAALDYFGRRQNNSYETKVERLQAALAAEGHDVSRGEIVELFRRLQELGCGVFVVGRKGWSSRFQWAVGLTELGRFAAGEKVAVEPISAEVYGGAPDADDADDADLREHRYWIRPDLELRLALPPDLTTTEAGRLADFIRTLPIN